MMSFGTLASSSFQTSRWYVLVTFSSVIVVRAVSADLPEQTLLSEQGPWVVQRAVGTKPLIVGRALKVCLQLI